MCMHKGEKKGEGGFSQFIFEPRVDASPTFPANFAKVEHEKSALKLSPGCRRLEIRKRCEVFFHFSVFWWETAWVNRGHRSGGAKFRYRRRRERKEERGERGGD